MRRQDKEMRKRMEQVGFVVLGGGLNRRAAVQVARQDGYDVRRGRGCLTLFRAAKTK